LSVSSMLPPLRGQRRLQRVSYFGASARLQHLLPTLQEWCCHHPCKARFRLAGLPLPGGSRTLWIALKGFRSFRSHFHSPFLDLSWRYHDELPPSHRSSPEAAMWGSLSRSGLHWNWPIPPIAVIAEATVLTFFAAREAARVMGFGCRPTRPVDGHRGRPPKKGGQQALPDSGPGGHSRGFTGLILAAVVIVAGFIRRACGY
jgi:hypothetical protein